MTLARRSGLWPLLLPLLALGALLLAPAASPAAATRSVDFDGRTVEVPQAWPVYRLDRNPRMCVRMDRRAVYLGTPSAYQRCPAEAMGRQRAILVEPRSAARASALPRARRGATASAGGAIFTGLGFDACAAPSSRSMAAWGSSPYRAVGVYIGGINRACSQPNLTPSWVAAQTEADWHLIPTYVGLQAPTSACSSCAKLSASQATAQGAAAAIDAVEEASAVAIGPGSPIYFDMESYSQTSSATAATLAFLEAWTQKLRQLGYSSGVYSSSASGIEDLAGQIGSGYELPDAIWIANWNGEQNTSDPVVPSTAWTPHQRIHQYRGGHNETYGGVTINIDNNYVDGPTVGDRHPRRRRRPDRLPRPRRLAGPRPVPRPRLGLRPQPPLRTAIDPALGRRQDRHPGRRRLRPRPGREPARDAMSRPSSRKRGRATASTSACRR